VKKNKIIKYFQTKTFIQKIIYIME